MNTYKEQLQEVQEFAMGIIKEFPIDKTAANVLAALANANNQDRIEFFKLNKDNDAGKIYHDLAASGTIEKYLETYAFLSYINE